MSSVSVVRYSRHRLVNDKSSPIIYLLKQEPRSSKVYTIQKLAEEIESIGSLSVEDVTHVMQSFVRAMRKVLTEGNRVKVDGLGTFFISLSCPGVTVEKECTVKNITRVNLRFKVDNALRLVNDSTATTRSAPNNVSFEIYNPSAGGGNSGGGDDGEIDNPGA